MRNHKHVQPPVNLAIDVCGCDIAPKPYIRDICFIIDNSILMARYARRFCQVLYSHIHSIARIRNCLIIAAWKTIVHVLFIYRVDHGNALLYGGLETLLHQLQMIQNAAARLIAGNRRRDHITPVLFSLSWLPVHQ